MTNQTTPSSGAAELRLTDTARAVLETLRGPFTAAVVYENTDAIPSCDDLYDPDSATQTALRELVDAGLVTVEDRDGETHYRAATAPPAIPHGNACTVYRSLVLNKLRDAAKPLAAFEVIPRWMDNVLAVDALFDLVLDGTVKRTPRTDGAGYTYEPAEPPLPHVNDTELLWLRVVDQNDGVLHTPNGSTGAIVRANLGVRGLLARYDSVLDGCVAYELTDLGRRVLAAHADTEASA